MPSYYTSMDTVISKLIFQKLVVLCIEILNKTCY